MTPLTRRDVLSHQTHVPWPSQRQVEQDLLLCRSMAAIFNDTFLRGQVAMRGGTKLCKTAEPKLHSPTTRRFSTRCGKVVRSADNAPGASGNPRLRAFDVLLQVEVNTRVMFPLKRIEPLPQALATESDLRLRSTHDDVCDVGSGFQIETESTPPPLV